MQPPFRLHVGMLASNLQACREHGRHQHKLHSLEAHLNSFWLGGFQQPHLAYERLDGLQPHTFFGVTLRLERLFQKSAQEPQQRHP